MSLFRMPRWLRRLIRRNTSPVPEIQAHLIRKKISFLYAFLAWNVCGYIIYQVYTGKVKKQPSELSEGRQFAKFFKAENVTLVRIEGLTHVGTVDLEEEKRREKNKEKEFVGEEECITMDQEDLNDSEK